MTGDDGKNGVVKGLEGAFAGALARLKGAAPTPRAAAETPLFAADPTSILMPGDPPRDDEGGALPLAAQLEESARSIVRRSDELREQGNRLIAAIGRRIDGEVTIRTQGFRAFLSFGWMAIAAWLYLGVTAASGSDMAVLQNGMPVDEARVMMKTFVMVAAAGFGGAALVGALTTLFGNSDNARVRAEGEAFGLAIADTAREFDRTLTKMRERMDDHDDPADAIVELSRSHLTALEATAYFREIAFLAGSEGPHALRLFRGFLHRPAGNPPPLPVFLLGALITFILMYVFAVPHPAPDPDATAAAAAAQLAFMKYPLALAALLGGGFVYAVAGLFFTAFSGLVVGDTAARAREEALAALRGAFTAREAPRPHDIVRRIEDTIDVFRARIQRGKNRAGDSSHGFSTGSAQSGDDFEDVPEWRRRDTSVKFVETGFGAAPARWRVDPEVDFSAREPGAKRDGESLEKPRRR